MAFVLQAQGEEKETEVALESLYTVADPEQIQSVIQALPTVEQQQTAARGLIEVEEKEAKFAFVIHEMKLLQRQLDSMTGPIGDLIEGKESKARAFFDKMFSEVAAQATMLSQEIKERLKTGKTTTLNLIRKGQKLLTIRRTRQTVKKVDANDLLGAVEALKERLDGMNSQADSAKAMYETAIAGLETVSKLVQTSEVTAYTVVLDQAEQLQIKPKLLLDAAIRAAQGRTVKAQEAAVAVAEVTKEQEEAVKEGEIILAAEEIADQVQGIIEQEVTQLQSINVAMGEAVNALEAASTATDEAVSAAEDFNNAVS